MLANLNSTSRLSSQRVKRNRYEQRWATLRKSPKPKGSSAASRLLKEIHTEQTWSYSPEAQCCRVCFLLIITCIKYDYGCPVRSFFFPPEGRKEKEQGLLCYLRAEFWPEVPITIAEWFLQDAWMKTVIIRGLKTDKPAKFSLSFLLPVDVSTSFHIIHLSPWLKKHPPLLQTAVSCCLPPV